MIVIIAPVAACLVGLLIYLVTDKAKPQRLGEIMFASGLLVTLFMLAGDRSPLLHLR